MSYHNIITIKPDKRGGKPCIRGMRITVYDVLGWLAAGMSHAEILEDFPERLKSYGYAVEMRQLDKLRGYSVLAKVQFRNF